MDWIERTKLRILFLKYTYYILTVKSLNCWLLSSWLEMENINFNCDNLEGAKFSKCQYAVISGTFNR